MDVSADGIERPGQNTTDVIVIAEDRIETLSIIVWCVGGILLIALLSLLARIILAKKKHVWDEYDQFGFSPTRRGGHRFRIYIDSRGHVIDPGSPSRDTASLVSCSDMGVTETPVICRTPSQYHSAHIGAQRQSAAQSSNNSFRYPDCANIDNEILTRNLRVGEYINSLPVPVLQSGDMLQTDDSGSRATVNGVVISPPPYTEVVGHSGRIPSVVVDRDAPSHTHPRFSL